jgi:tetratricopeptide (TPR) repeat protein
MYYDGVIAGKTNRVVLAAVSALVLMLPRTAAAQNDLERARTYYNAGQFAESIAAATSAISKPATANSARLIIARARLEQFRKIGDPTELAEARRELVSLKPAGLAPQEAIEWQIGVGTALFLEDQLGPAAEIFATLLPSARARLSSEEYQKLLDWWGTAVSKLAESLTGDARKQNYEKLRADARTELERNPFSRPATYWTVVASRGVGDLDGAWNAAITGWIRMSGQPDGQQLQTDLGTFVTRTLIPERAQARTGQRPETKQTMTEMAAMNEEWRTLVARWDGKD